MASRGAKAAGCGALQARQETVDWHGRPTDGPGEAEGQAGLAATAHSDALAPHEEDATEAEDAAQG